MCFVFGIDEPEQRIDAVVGARGMAVVLNRAAPAAQLHYPCINHFRRCLDTQDNEVSFSLNYNTSWTTKQLLYNTVSSSAPHTESVATDC